MKKHLLMLLCAVSLLAHTVQAAAPATTEAMADAGADAAGKAAEKAALEAGVDAKTADKIGDAAEDAAEKAVKKEGRIARFWNSAKAGSRRHFGDHWAGVTPGDMTTRQVQDMLSPSGDYSTMTGKRLDQVNAEVAQFMKDGKHKIPFYKRRLTGRLPVGTSDALRMANVINTLDLAVRDKDALAARLIARLGRRAGFRSGNGWRGRVADVVGSDSKAARASRTVAALLLAGALDKGLALPVGGNSLVGNSYRGAKSLFSRHPLYGPDPRANIASAHAANRAMVSTTGLFGDDAAEYENASDYEAPTMADFLKDAEARGDAWGAAADKRAEARAKLIAAQQEMLAAAQREAAEEAAAATINRLGRGRIARQQAQDMRKTAAIDKAAEMGTRRLAFGTSPNKRRNNALRTAFAMPGRDTKKRTLAEFGL